MKNFTLLLLVISFSIASCKTENQENSTSIPTITLVDSMEVDYLGVVWLMDYDPQSEKLLLANDSYFQYLEIDRSGKILDSARLSSDGPDAIDMALGMGYFEGKVTVATSSDGFKILEKGKITDQIKIPYAYHAFNFLPNLGLYPWKDGVLYGRFTADSLQTNGEFDAAYYERTYTDPILEYQKDGKVKGVLTLPEDSPLRDGKFHGPITSVTEFSGDQLYYANWMRPEIYIYQTAGEDLVYQKTVKVDIPGWVFYDPVEMTNAANFYDFMGSKMAGNLTNILPFGDHFVIVYTKGIAEDQFSQIDFKDPNARQLINSINRPFFGILDKDFNAIQLDIPLPAAASTFMVASPNGDIWISKNPSLADTEDNGPVIYQLRFGTE